MVGVRRESPPPRGNAHIETVGSHSIDSRNREAPQRRGGGNTRRSTRTESTACLLRSDSAPRRGRCRNVVPHCSRLVPANSPLKTELPGVLRGLDFGAHARQDRIEILES